jgi:hypothetical protein
MMQCIHHNISTFKKLQRVALDIKEVIVLEQFLGILTTCSVLQNTVFSSFLGMPHTIVM